MKQLLKCINCSAEYKTVKELQDHMMECLYTSIDNLVKGDQDEYTRARD